MRSRVIVLAVTACLFASCSATRRVFDVEQQYAPDDPVEVESRTTFSNAEYDEVWEAVIKYFADGNIPIDTLEKDSGIVVARKMVSSTLIDPGIVRPGRVRTSIQLVKEFLRASQFYGAANTSYVRESGTVTKRTPEGEPRVEESTADYRFSITFNVFVQRYKTDEIVVSVNATYQPESTVTLNRGTTGYFSKKQSDQFSAEQVLSDPRLRTRGILADPKTTGLYEAQLLAFLHGEVGRHP